MLDPKLFWRPAFENSTVFLYRGTVLTKYFPNYLFFFQFLVVSGCFSGSIYNYIQFNHGYSRFSVFMLQLTCQLIQLMGRTSGVGGLPSTTNVSETFLERQKEVDQFLYHNANVDKKIKE
jgi:hypothetical protein